MRLSRLEQGLRCADIAIEAMGARMARRVLQFIIIGSIAFAATAGSVRAMEKAAELPDLSGPWARSSMDPELMASGPIPLVNLRRAPDDPHPNGGGDPLPLVGDYHNPILRPQ